MPVHSGEDALDLRVWCGTPARHRTLNMAYHPFYRVWANMLSRCHNPKATAYAEYGGRGITVCDRWHQFEFFYEDMWAAYHPGLSIDRIDNEGHYCPRNCRWATHKTQAANKRQRLPATSYERGPHGFKRVKFPVHPSDELNSNGRENSVQ
jgi:hypothetical protein